MKFEKPIVIVSKCLEFEPVRYNAQIIPSKIVKDLIPFVNFIKICPEADIGLPIPREPIRIVKKEEEYRLIQPKTGIDLTDKMINYTDNLIKNLKEFDGAIFKSKSPSIGARNVKVYAKEENSHVIESRAGFFSKDFIEKYENYPIEEEDRLRNKIIREHFLIKLFLFANLRVAKKDENKMEEFHKSNRLLIKLYSLEKLENIEKSLTEKNYENYFEIIKKTFNKYPNIENFSKIFKEIILEFENKLNSEEKENLNLVIEKYENNLLSEYEVLEVLKINLIRFELKEIYNQSIFEPYPQELRVRIDEKREKNYWN